MHPAPRAEQRHERQQCRDEEPPARFALPRPMLGRADANFSLSGLKTAVRNEASRLTPLEQQDIAVTIRVQGWAERTWQGKIAVLPESEAQDLPGGLTTRGGGPLAVTDANVMLGKLQPDFFPRIFGPGQNEPLDAQAVG